MSGPASQPPNPKSCSALSPHAKPNDDWRNMPVPADRRRAQNRVAQRKYRAKVKGRQQEPREGQRPVSTSPSSSDAFLDEPQPSPRSQYGSSSGAAFTNPGPPIENFAHPPQVPLFPPMYPEQNLPVHGNQPLAASQQYSRSPMTPTPVHGSFPGYVQPSSSSHFRFPQSTIPPELSSPFVPFTNSLYPTQYAVGGSPLTITSGPPFTPVTPTSQGDYYPATEGSCYDMGYAAAYDNSQAPATQGYTDSAGSVNMPDFFHHQNYPSS